MILYYTFWQYQNCNDEDKKDAHIQVYINKDDINNNDQYEIYIKSFEYIPKIPLNIHNRVVIVVDNIKEEIIKMYDWDIRIDEIDEYNDYNDNNYKIYSTDIENNIYELFEDNDDNINICDITIDN